MNKWFGMGRLTRDPEIRYGQSGGCIAKYSIAVDRRYKQNGETQTDFFNLTSFGKQGEFVEKYLHKGTKILVEGELHNNNYTNKNGEKVYATDIVTSSVEFAESKAASERNGGGGGNTAEQPQEDEDGFMPMGDDEPLPF